MREQLDWALRCESLLSAGIRAVGLGGTGWAGVYTPVWSGPQDLIVEGLSIQNAKPPATYTAPSGEAGTKWIHQVPLAFVYIPQLSGYHGGAWDRRK